MTQLNDLVDLVLGLLGTITLRSNAELVYFLTSSEWEFRFVHILTNDYCLNYCHSDWYGVSVSFFWWLVRVNIFHVLWPYLFYLLKSAHVLWLTYCLGLFFNQYFEVFLKNNLDIRPLSNVSWPRFSLLLSLHLIDCLFFMQKFFNSMRSHLLFVGLISWAIRVLFRTFLCLYLEVFSLLFFISEFRV